LATTDTAEALAAKKASKSTRETVRSQDFLSEVLTTFPRMTSKPSPWPPEPHRTLATPATKSEPTPEEQELAKRIAAIDAEIERNA